MDILFPEYNQEWDTKGNGPDKYHRYYNIHYKYILNIFKYCGINIKMVNPTIFNLRHKTAFELKINNKLVLIDFSDFEYFSIEDISKYSSVFKFHYNSKLHSTYSNVYPFSSVTFHNWETYYTYVKKYKYTASGKIYNQQSPAGNALERRKHVRELLSNEYGDDLVYERTSSNIFYKNVSKCLVSICVPGARNNMLDRGQGQYMLLGGCTISPKLETVLSYNRKLEPGVHYIECKEDYSDLIEKIEYCKNNKDICLKIGQNVKELMQSTSTPEKQIEWIKKCLNNEI